VHNCTGALEAAGITFQEEIGTEGPGVRLKKSGEGEMTTDLETALTFAGDDYRNLLDILIDANERMDRSQRHALRVEIGGETYGLQGIAKLIQEKVGYETDLTEAHDHRLNADWHNRLIKKRQYGYGRTAMNLANRAVGKGGWPQPSEAALEARRQIMEAERRKLRDEQIAKHLRQKLEEAAIEAHASWREITEPLIMVGKRTFARVDSKGPHGLDGLLKWFERTHPDEVERIRSAIIVEDFKH
jgi:hypothetical protein